MATKKTIKTKAETAPKKTLTKKVETKKAVSQKDAIAVIQLSGRQYLVHEGDKIVVDHIEGEAGGVIKADQVLLIKQGDETLIGQPILEGASVELRYENDFKGEKIRTAKFKAKSRYRRVTGSRQLLSNLVVTAIKSK